MAETTLDQLAAQLEPDWRANACRNREKVEAIRRASLGPDGRAWEDYASRWAEMQRGR